MSTRTVVILIVAVAIAIAGAVTLLNRQLGSPELPAAGPVVAFRIDQEATAESAIEILHEGWPAVERILLAGATHADALAALHDAGDFRTGSVLCFDPGMAFRVGSGHDAIDALICLKCDNVYFFRVDERIAYKRLRLTPAGHTAFARMYESLFGRPAEPSMTTATTTSAATATRQ